MASPWAHALAGAAVGSLYPAVPQRRRVIALAAICAVLPDLDLIGWPLGISPYALLGHRGLMHSIPFAVVLGIGATALLPAVSRRDRFLAGALLALATATHSVLDALTAYAPTGPAFWAPFTNDRYRFQWQPLTGSGGLHTDFGRELVYICLPSLALMSVLHLIHRRAVLRPSRPPA